MGIYGRMRTEQVSGCGESQRTSEKYVMNKQYSDIESKFDELKQDTHTTGRKELVPLSSHLSLTVVLS